MSLIPTSIIILTCNSPDDVKVTLPHPKPIKPYYCLTTRDRNNGAFQSPGQLPTLLIFKKVCSIIYM